MKICYHPGCLALGIGAEKVGIYDEMTSLRFRILYCKVDFMFWSLRWSFRITRKTKD